MGSSSGHGTNAGSSCVAVLAPAPVHSPLASSIGLHARPIVDDPHRSDGALASLPTRLEAPARTGRTPDARRRKTSDEARAASHRRRQIMKGQTYKRCKCPAGDLPRRAGGTLGNCRRDQGSWYYRHDLPTGAAGRRRQVCRGFSKKKEARAALTDALARLDRERYVDRSKLTVGDYLDQYIRAGSTCVQRPSCSTASLSSATYVRSLSIFDWTNCESTTWSVPSPGSAGASTAMVTPSPPPSSGDSRRHCERP